MRDRGREQVREVRPDAIAPMAVIVRSPCPPRLTIAMIWALPSDFDL